MKAVNIDEWQPADGYTLEDKALEVAKSTSNCLVVAGPGAGKTELLAQRADCLLKTNLCTFPRRILAISFKKDAAYNLRERVQLRCGDPLSRRFESLTFDSFAKQLLDRFKRALPENWAILDDYEISYVEKNIVDHYKSISADLVNTTPTNELLDYHYAIDFASDATTNNEKIRQRVWLDILNGNPVRLTFKAIMVLAIQVLKSNPTLRTYLQQTYQFVFLDEFQDTTDLQYSLFKTCFIPSSCTFTAVGDDKQMIMRWAGANDKIFQNFMADTKAGSTPLTMNFRSAPELVDLQNYLIKHLLGKSDFSKASPKWDKGKGEAFLWFYDKPEDETADLLKQINAQIKEGIPPREICILVKQQLAKYATALIDTLNSNGIKARDESRFQDLLSSETGLFLLNTMQVCFDKRSLYLKTDCVHFISNIKTDVQDSQLLRTEVDFADFVSRIQDKYKKIKSDAELSDIVDEMVGFAGRDRIISSVPTIANQAELDELIKSLKLALKEYFGITNDVVQTLDGIVGIDTIPVMTIHKSKGLEYHTIIFIGLEDSAFWSFDKQPDEDKSAFFVALSRAKLKVVFTFSAIRPNNYGKNEAQQLDRVQVFMKALQDSKLVEVEDKGHVFSKE